MNVTKTKNSQKEATYRYLKKQRLELIEFLGGVCVKCGFSDIRALQIDHKNGGGSQQYKKMGNNETYRYYNKNRREAQLELQVLCANCNWIKKYEEKETR